MPENNIIELAIKKLEEESQSRPSTKVFAEYLKSKCQSDIELATNIIKKDKTLKGLMDYVMVEAKKKATNGFSVVEDSLVFKWAESYFGIDKPVISEEDISVAAHAVKQGASITIKEKTITKKAKKTEPENQVSLFDMM